MPARSETCAGSTPRSRSASCATFASASPWWTIRATSGRRCGAPPAPERRPLWRYRVGGWRIVARIEDDVLRVLVLRIAHRREVYR